MSAKACTVVGIVMLMLTWAGAQPAPQGQYLIERIGGRWEVREKGKDRALTGKYDVILAASQVRCLEAPCILDYSTDGAAKPVFAKAPAVQKWTPVPPPSEAPVARSAADLQRLIAAAGVRGGATKAAAACSGVLPLLAPRCLELIDPDDFSIRWTANPADAGKLLAFFVGPTQSTDRRRWNANADAGVFQSKAVQDYLASLEQPNGQADVTLRLMRTESLDAVRQIHIPGKAEQAEHRRILRTFDQLPELPRTLAYLEQYLKMHMWSRAADMSRALLEGAPDSLEVKRYALIGFCGSDFADEVAKLRSALRDAGVTGICDGESGGK